MSEIRERAHKSFISWTTVKRKIEITLKIERGRVEFESGRKERKKVKSPSRV